MNTPNHLEI